MKNKDEDYTDDVDEKIDVQSKPVQMNTFETNQNNLNEMFFNPMSRFYTSPNEYNGSFTETMINPIFPQFTDKEYLCCLILVLRCIRIYLLETQQSLMNLMQHI